MKMQIGLCAILLLIAGADSGFSQEVHGKVTDVQGAGVASAVVIAEREGSSP